MLDPISNDNKPKNSNRVQSVSGSSADVDSSQVISAKRAEFEEGLFRQLREQGLEPVLEWVGNVLNVHTFVENLNAIPTIDQGRLANRDSQFTLAFKLYPPSEIDSQGVGGRPKGLSQGSQSIRELRKQLSDRYGRHRNWRVSEDYTTSSLVLFYSGSSLHQDEVQVVREIISRTTSLPVRIERRVNQTLLTQKILESRPDGISCGTPAFFDEKFGVVSVPRYAAGTNEASLVRSWQVQLRKIGRQFGVGIVLRPSAVGHAFFRLLQKSDDPAPGRIANVETIQQIRQHFFPEPPIERETRTRARVKVDLPMLSVDPLGSDNMPVPGDTFRSEADPEDLIWAGRRPDGGYRFVSAIYDVTDSVKLTTALLKHLTRFGQSFYSPMGSYPLLGKELAFLEACFQEGKPGDAFFVDIQVAWDGTLEEFSIYDGYAESVAQHSFKRADKILAGEDNDKTAPVLNVLRDFALARRINRVAQSEVRLESHSRGGRYDSIATIVIEESMLITKAIIGQYFHDRGITIVNRVYGPPNEKQRELLQSKLAYLDIAVDAEDLLDQKIVSSIVNDLQNLRQTGNEQQRHDSGEVLNEFFMSHQFGASYSSEEKGHGDLGFPFYAPIKGREGPGIINQALLRASLDGDDPNAVFSAEKLAVLARAFTRSDHFYDSRAYGLVFLQTLERSLEIAKSDSFYACWDGAAQEMIVPLFNGRVQALISDYQSIEKDLRTVVLDGDEIARKGSVGPVEFLWYNADEHQFEFALLK